jgi:Calcineurin-like phosphoesterase
VSRFLVHSIQVFLGFCVLGVGLYLGCAFQGVPYLPEPVLRPLHDSAFVFVSDTQAPLWPETFILSRNNHEEARGLILGEILKKNPGAVFHCGDIVALGFNQNYWKPMDEFVSALYGRQTAFYPVLGNHEYIIFPGRGEWNFEQRYPFAPSTGYLVRMGPLAIVLLNSNFSAMANEDCEKQQQWYEKTMSAMDADTAVRGLIVACHHSPFTNSRIVDPSEEVQGRFVPRFLGSPKGMFFISGHCHAAEHFQEEGKNFLVVGGGGGLQHPLLLGDAQRWRDHFPVATEKRMFHYLAGKVSSSGIEVGFRMLKPDFSGFEDVYSIAVPWPRDGQPTIASALRLSW